MSHPAPPQIHIQDGAVTEQILHPDPLYPQVIVPAAPPTHFLEPFGPPEVDDRGVLHAPRRMSASHSLPGIPRAASPTRQADFAQRTPSFEGSSPSVRVSTENGRSGSPVNSPSPEQRRAQLSPRVIDATSLDSMGPPKSPRGGTLGDVQRAVTPRAAVSPRVLSPQGSGSYGGALTPGAVAGFDSPLSPGRRSAEEVLHGHYEHRDQPQASTMVRSASRESPALRRAGSPSPDVDPIFASPQRTAEEVLYGHRKPALEPEAGAAEPPPDHATNRTPGRSPRQHLDRAYMSPDFVQNATDVDEVLTPGGAFLAITDDDRPRAPRPHLSSSDRPHPEKTLSKDPRSSLEIHGFAAHFHVGDAPPVDGPVAAAAVTTPPRASAGDDRRPKLLSPEYLNGPAEWPATTESPTNGDPRHVQHAAAGSNHSERKAAHPDSGLVQFLQEQHEHPRDQQKRPVAPPSKLGPVNPDFAVSEGTEEIVYKGGAYLEI